jgi:NAD(P)-dependent dehydrogenase (short-subunit alcohol dehydrogenase family)
VRKIREATANEDVELLRADLSSQASIRELADHFLTEHDRLHVLVNCAGAFFRDRRVTIDGLEMTFALNHLAYSLLTTLLLDLLRGSARRVDGGRRLGPRRRAIRERPMHQRGAVARCKRPDRELDRGRARIPAACACHASSGSFGRAPEPLDEGVGSGCLCAATP